jgi:conserved oligomeric Golgi complex subunit 4
MRPLISSVSMDLSYVIDEAQLDELETRQPFLKRFQKSFASLDAPYATSLTTRNNFTLTGFMVDHFAKEWERILMGMQVNAFGATRLESDVRGVVTMLVNNQWSPRDKMTRMSQIALLLNLQSANEVLEYWGVNSGPIVWRLTPTQVKKVLMLRIDFDKREIEDLVI